MEKRDSPSPNLSAIICKNAQIFVISLLSVDVIIYYYFFI